MAIVMNMSSYVVEETDATENNYSDEAMRVGMMNPPLQLALQQHNTTLVKRHAALPPSLAAVDIEVFLQKMCANRR